MNEATYNELKSNLSDGGKRLIELMEDNVNVNGGSLSDWEDAFDAKYTYKQLSENIPHDLELLESVTDEDLAIIDKLIEAAR